MSLRTRLLVGMASIALVLVAVALTVTRTTEAYLIRQLDDQLVRAGERVGDRDGRPGRFPPPDANRPLIGDENPTTLFVAVVDNNELVTVNLPNLTRAQATAPALDVAEVEDLAGRGIVTVGSEGSNLRYRALVRTVAGRAVLYALPLEDVDRAVGRLVLVEALASAAIMAVLGLSTFWVLRLGVRPVKAMTATAAAIGGGDLSRRIPESAAGTEAGDLGLALNSMLGRLEESFTARARSEERLRQFVADASHELRTPVTTIRGYAELYRAGGLRGAEDLGEAMRRTEQEAIRMGSLVEDLLNLARLDEGRPLERHRVDLAAVVRDAALDARAVQPDRPVSVEAPGPVVVEGDDALIRQVVANVVANARVHTSPETPVRLRAGIEGDLAVVEVADDGPGMEPDVAARAFERFYRADPARTRHTGGSGLGLSIVAATMAAHGGSASIDSAPGRGTVVRLSFPMRAAAAPAATARAVTTTPDGTGPVSEQTRK